MKDYAYWKICICTAYRISSAKDISTNCNEISGQPNARKMSLTSILVDSFKSRTLTGKIGQNDHLIPEQKDHPFAGAN